MPGFAWLPVLGSIILLDLVLSGDNALIIGAAASGIPAELRRLAFIVGGAGAILLRIVLTYSDSLLLYIPVLKLIGGLVVFFIATRLLLTKEARSPVDGSSDKNARARTKTSNLPDAILTILVADIVMSFDNVVAIAAVAKSYPVLLVAGLLFSIIVLFIGSALIARLMDTFPWLMAAAAFILAVTAAQLISQDQQLPSLLPLLASSFKIFSWNISWYIALVYGALLSIIFCIIWIWWRNSYRDAA